MEILHNEVDGGVTVVVVNGRVDSATAPKMEEHLQELIKVNKTQLGLDLQAVD